MRWFKHITTSYDDQKIAAVLDELGMEGYGFWWRILEVIAQQLDENSEPFCEYSPKKWGEFFGFSAKKFEKFIKIFEKNKIFQVEYLENSENRIRVTIPNLLKYRDEYTDRKAKKSGECRNNIGTNSRSPRARVKDTEAELEKNISNTPPLSPPRGVSCECEESFSRTHEPPKDKNSEAGTEVLQAEICQDAELSPVGMDQFFNNVNSLAEKESHNLQQNEVCANCEIQQDENTKTQFVAEISNPDGISRVQRSTATSTVTMFSSGCAETRADNSLLPDKSLTTQQQIETKKRKSSAGTIHDLREAINAFTLNPELQSALDDFRKMRERIRKPLTDRALKLLFAELEKLAPGNDELKVKILEQSIFHSWQGVFELREKKIFSTGSGNMFSPQGYSQNLSPGQKSYLNGMKVLQEREARRQGGVANGQ